MKGIELESIAILAGAAATIFGTGRPEAGDTAKKLLDEIERLIPSQGSLPCNHGLVVGADSSRTIGEAGCANGAEYATEALHPGDIIISRTRLEYLEAVEQEIARLATLIDLHDKAFAISAKGATNELGAEITAIIAKYKRA